MRHTKGSTKKIDGKRYSFRMATRIKSGAQDSADRMRERGYNARVIETTYRSTPKHYVTMHAVYIRKAKKK